jgi:RND family efflux transporter MFP subunit
MQPRVTRRAGIGLGLAAYLGLAGCSHSPPEAAAPAPPTVTVSHPLQREITDFAEYTGRTAAVDSVQVRARVTGYLDKINYKEGSEVTKRAVLYEIDPRPYQAALKQAQAQVSLQEAQVKYQQAVYQRNVQLRSAGTAQAVSLEELQQSLAQRNTAEASLQAARASVETAQLNLDWTKVTSPIDGLIGRTLVTRGNLVVADQTLLTTIVSQDPMYAYFDVDEPTVLRVQELIREGKYKSAREPGSRVPVFLGLATESGYPHQGYIDFISNQVNATTGTLQIRGTFSNPKPPVGPRLLTPGLFVRIRVAVSAPYSALLVTQAAIGADQNLHYVYVLNAKNEVERLDVQLGAVQKNGLQVITSGLSADDRIVVNGTQHVQPGVAVNPRLVPMPASLPAKLAPPAHYVPPVPPRPQPPPSMKQSYPPQG